MGAVEKSAASFYAYIFGILYKNYKLKISVYYTYYIKLYNIPNTRATIPLVYYTKILEAASKY